ncbi:MAG: Stk1 family PASTA domain-containing Ser/Thr kinase [Propionibacteriaceae bacterium]|nr:Stk1 family PASTA domain-containing Ser/Thr kinase [Propionibacteriaceae bacterium]
MDTHNERPDRLPEGDDPNRLPEGQDPNRLAEGEPTEPTSVPRRAAGPVDEVPDATSVRVPDEPPMYAGPPPHDDEATRVAQAVVADEPEEAEAGRLLGGRYQLDRVIGRGGMAEVHRAYDVRLGRWVAVKELRADLASDNTFQARFRREAQSAAGLNHPNIVAVYDTGEEYDPISKLRIPFIVMELVEGHTLRDILKDDRKILPERALELARGVLEALSYSHRAGIVHRDIKPANVMLTPQGNVKVMDFGIARAVSDVSSSMTQTAAVIGTAQYLSPEQARGETVDARSDIYSAGCLLYELLTGRPPFVGDSPVSVAYQHVRPSQIDGELGPGVDAVVLTALAKDPADRYQSARAMADDIDRVLAGLNVHATAPVSTPSPPEPTASVTTVVTHEEVEPIDDRPRRSSALPIVLTILSVVLVGLLGAVAWWWMRPTTPEPPPQVDVPMVVGLTQANAETAIRNARLIPKVEPVEGPENDTVGTVVRQNPPPGKLDVGKTVTIEVNTGSRKAAIPTGLKGSSVTEARRLLEDAGFTNIKVVDATTEPADATKDTVLTVQPGEGTTVSVTQEITLEVATGRTQMPRWVGATEEFVRDDAQARGFTGVVFEDDTSDPTVPEGQVVSTDPTVDTPIERSSRIVVRVARVATPSPTPEPTPTTPTTSPTPTTTTVPTTSPSPSVSE